MINAMQNESVIWVILQASPSLSTNENEKRIRAIIDTTSRSVSLVYTLKSIFSLPYLLKMKAIFLPNIIAGKQSKMRMLLVSLSITTSLFHPPEQIAIKTILLIVKVADSKT